MEKPRFEHIFFLTALFSLPKNFLLSPFKLTYLIKNNGLDLSSVKDI